MGKNNAKISNAVIKRLPRYRRYLIELKKKGVEKISSKEFSNLIGYTASQIRQDLNNFGGFGQQGYGYSVDGLYKEISAILGLDKEYRMVIVGAGNLGQAIAKYTHFHKQGFKVCAAFDINPNLIGKDLDGIEILDYENIVEYVEEEEIDIGIICVNRDNAQEVADKLSFAGVKGIWNFAPTDIEVPTHVALEVVHLSDSLHSLAYHMNDIQKKEVAQDKHNREEENLRD
ncbi:redox-sensing transcriptional repressor Rex [Aminicella lysinilytica]|uniref:redox-sensing transcriptional repressor Rex n=1 Tax=Aminicella lysinilytica TaxID=433323 RepID=UPI0017D87251|nr:redox-sensing transcriptional repressor Rex [Aminicella lysinilytica]NLD10328.1 redox-sensing transcriptional repressor Rex [Clostridiales bacterium]